MYYKLIPLFNKVVKKRKHGYGYHPYIRTYYSMIARCYNPLQKDYPNYGGRGISVCDEWKRSENSLGIIAFIHWIENQPDWDSLKLTIHRVDNDGNYSPDNCRLVTKSENSKYRRTANFVTLNGIAMPVKEAASIINKVDAELAAERIRHGWSYTDALLTPKGISTISIVGKTPFKKKLQSGIRKFNKRGNSD